MEIQEQKPKKKFLVPVIIVIVILAIIGGFFLYKNYQDKKYAEEYLKKAKDAIYNYNPQTENADWKKFDNNYISFEYPAAWTLKEKTSQDNAVNMVSLYSPEVSVDKDFSVSPYIINFYIRSASQYLSVIEDSLSYLKTDELYGIKWDQGKKDGLVQAIENGDLDKLSVVFSSPRIVQKTITINSKNALVIMICDKDIDVCEAYSLKLFSEGKLIEVKFLDLVNLPAPRTAELENNLVNLINETAYSRIIESIRVK